MIDIKKVLKTAITLSLVLFSICSFAQDAKRTNRTGMLILGSADLKTLEERVDVGYKLYASKPSFDYIIVSGGCGAHKSTICEASRMEALLVERGLPADKIFKEEKSKNTVQNYVYSRILENGAGEKIIRPDDTLYVVSNHWHAISVAARFSAYDGVQAFYYVEGRILPTTKDKVDYTDIFNKSTDNEAYTRSALWPLINASYSGAASGESYDVIGDLVFINQSDASKEPSILRIADMLGNLPDNWKDGIDAAFYDASERKVYWLKGASLLRFSPNSKSVDRGYPKLIKNWIKDLPSTWQAGFIDATFFHPISKDIYMFKGDEYLQVSSRSLKVKSGFPKKIITLAKNWPFGWGSGDLDAANFNINDGMIYLYRAKEFLAISPEGEIQSDYPKSIKIEWPESILGKK